MISLVTGASGFLGSHLTRLLVEQGHQVRVLVRPRSETRALAGLPVERVGGDLRDAYKDIAAVGVRHGEDVFYKFTPGFLIAGIPVHRSFVIEIFGLIALQQHPT